MYTKIMERKVTATEARIHFGELMQSVVNDQNPVIVEKSGKPQVVILSVEHYQKLQEDKNQNWISQLQETHALIETELNGKELPDPSEIIREQREQRDAQLVDMP